MNKYDECLKLCCYSDSDFSCFREPRPFNEKIYASDRHILLRVDKSKCENEYKSVERQPNYEKVMKETECNIVLPLSRLRKAFELIPKDEVQYGNGIKCKECNGYGTVEWTYCDTEGNYHYEDFDCPVCEGDGYLNIDQVIHNISAIAINKIPFPFILLQKIEKIATLLGHDNLTITFLRPDYPMQVKIEEGVDILIMSNTEKVPIIDIQVKPS